MKTLYVGMRNKLNKINKDVVQDLKYTHTHKDTIEIETEIIRRFYFEYLW